VNDYEQYIHKSRYARYIESESRRETWEETVQRYCESILQADRLGLPKSIIRKLREAILNREVMPSMRALMTAGPALARDNVGGYNCAYLPIDDRRAFDEIMYILMCGTGVGFSCESHSVAKLPTVAEEFYDDGTTTLHVADSRIGWATAYRKLISLLYDGLVPSLDYSKVRPSGARLRTFGGRASGAGPLQNLCNYTINTFKNAKGRKLNELEVHDLVCKIAEVIIAGGVRRSALISLSDVSSDSLRHAKHGSWHVQTPHRALANNSVCYQNKPDIGLFLKEWRSLIESKSGERGIFSRPAAERNMPARRDKGWEWGCNPCSEIILRPRQFCNLTEVIARVDDTDQTLKDKVELATILGTVQSTLTDFRYLGKKWKDNCEEERLLGVSLTGIMDCPLLNGVGEPVNLEARLQGLRDHAIATNKKWAHKIGIPRSAAITCVKPSGTVSQLVGSSSGIHPRYAEYYIRRVRHDLKDPLCQAMIDQGVPYEIDKINNNAAVFRFPMASPRGAVCIDSVTALEQLELWKTYAIHWCEHKPSVSIYVGEEEWLQVGSWVYDNFDIMSGVSFFPRDDHNYEQAPYEEIQEQVYSLELADFPKELDFNIEELDDSTTGSQELACIGGQCEL